MTGTPRKVVFVVPAMGLGGAERQVYTLMRELDSARYVPVLVALNSAGYFYGASLAEGIECHLLDVRGRFPVSGYRAFRSLLRDLRADIAVARGFNATTLTRLAMLGRRGPRVIVAEHSTGHDSKRTGFHTLVDRLLARRTAAFVGVAEGQRAYLTTEKHVPKARLIVIHNGIDPQPYLSGDRAAARASMGIPPTSFVAGIVAAMRPEKDHATFLEACALLAESIPDARFVLVGDGPERRRVEQTVVRLGLQKRTVLTGAREDVENILPACDVFSLTSVTIETLPMAVIEAMAAGMPVVATDVGGLRELVEPGVTGVLVQPRDPAAVARAWTALASNPQHARAMGEAGRDKALREFSASAMVAAYEDLFDDVLAGRPVGGSGR